MKSTRQQGFPVGLAAVVAALAGVGITVVVVTSVGAAPRAEVEPPETATLMDPPEPVRPATPKPATRKKKTVAVPVHKTPPLRRSTLPFTVRGSLVSATAEWSMATLEDTRTRAVRTVMEGAALEGARVVAIQRSRVLVETSEGLAFIDQAPPGAAPVLTSVAEPTRRGASGARGTTPTRQGADELPGLRSVGEGAWRVPRSELESLAANPMALMNDARIQPAMAGGAASGFKLAWIRPGSLYARIGLKSGDVLRRVNGLSLDSHEKMLLAYQQLREAWRIDLEVERGGGTVRHTYAVE